MTRACSILVFIVALAAAPLPALAEDGRSRESVETELQKTKTRIDEEESKIAKLKRDEASLHTQVDRLTLEQAKLDEQEKSARAEVARAEKESLIVELAAAETQARLDCEEVSLRSRIIAVYKMKRRTAAVTYLLESSSALDLMKRLRYLLAVIRYDKSVLDELGGTVEELAREKKQLELLKAKRESSLKRIETVQQDIENKKIQRASVLADVEAKKKLQEMSLAKLERSAANLENVLQKLMGSEESEKPEKVQRPEKVAPPPAVVASFEGGGLGSLRGKLPLPVPGKVVQRFGAQRHEEFSDMLFYKGLEFSSGVGEKVKPVADGKVVLTQNLPGFGNVVIVDHGERYYTLYGRLASTVCQIGDSVNRSSVLGVLGEPDFRGRNFYFELRFKGKAVDPVSYFASKLG